MSSIINSFDAEHKGIIHDAQYDYYGTKLATAGSDGKINIFEISSNKSVKKIAELSKHEHSIWQLAWSHPRFGNLLASCGFDKKVIIWKEMSQNVWERIFEYNEHKNSVNALSFCPHEYGLILLCGSSDGSISLHEYKTDHWISKKFDAHSEGVTSVSWGPALNPITFDKDEVSGSNNQLAPMRFVTGGCDNFVKIWTFTPLSTLEAIEENNIAEKIKTENLEPHSDWVRDVAWLNYVGYACDTIASCSEDQSVFIWKNINKKWVKCELKKKFDSPLWKVSWSHCGSYLAVSSGDNSVYIFSENVDGTFEELSQINQENNIYSNSNNEILINN